MCAALIRRGESSPLSGGHSIEVWLRRGAAMMPSTASQRRPVTVSRWLRQVRLWNSLRQLLHAGDNHQRVVSQCARGHFLLPTCTFRLLRRPSTRSLGWSEEKLCTTSDAATSLALRSSNKPCLLPCAPVLISPGFDPPCQSPLRGHVDDVQCQMARQCRLA